MRLTTLEKTQKINNFIPLKLIEEKHTYTPPNNKTNNDWSLISISINGLNFPAKRHGLSEWICKQNLLFCCIQEIHLSHKDSYYFSIKDWKIFQANGTKKQVGVDLKNSAYNLLQASLNRYKRLK